MTTNYLFKGRAYYKEKCDEWKLIQEVMSKFIKEMNEDGDY